ETQRQRHDAGCMTDELDRKIQEADPKRCGGWTPELLHVAADALNPDSVEMVIDPCRDRAPERDVDVAGRSNQPRHEPHVVAAEDENAKGGDERQTTPSLRADPLFQELEARRQAVFEDDLQLARI